MLNICSLEQIRKLLRTGRQFTVLSIGSFFRSLASSFQLDHQVDISLYLTARLLHSRELSRFETMAIVRSVPLAFSGFANLLEIYCNLIPLSENQLTYLSNHPTTYLRIDLTRHVYFVCVCWNVQCFNPIRLKFPSLFENVVPWSLKYVFLFQLDHQVDNSIYLTEATTL